VTEIIADNLTVEFPIATLKARSLKSIAVAAAKKVGGRVIDDHGISIVRALSDVSFHLKEGDRLALVGHNGAGKTTLLRTLAGIYRPTLGTVSVKGRCLTMFDISLGADEDATGYENIMLRGLVMGLKAPEIEARMEQIAEFSELGAYLDLPVRTYSSGMIMRLMFSISTAIEGDIIMMDEWLAVGDAAFAQKADQRLKEVLGKIGILVIASHNIHLMANICTHALHIESGRVLAYGSASDVLGPMIGQPATAAPGP
jgi:ABC-2 type transport system ATP-binding protein